MKRCTMALLLLLISTTAWAATDKDKRIAEIQQEMIQLGQKAQACGQDMSCLAAVQQQMEAMAREYSELISGSTPASTAGTTSDPCASSSGPCCGVEQQKQYIRDTFHAEPSWIQCMPVTFELIWDVYENSDVSTEKYVFHQEFPGHLTLSYDQKDKTCLLDFAIVGQPLPGQVQNRLASIAGVFSPIDTAHLKSRPSSNPADYTMSTDVGIGFEWSSQFGAKASGGMDGPWPADRVCGGSGCKPEETFGDVRFDAKGTDTFSWDEVRDGIKTGTCSKDFKITWPAPGMPANHIRKGKVTVIVNFKPTGGMEVTPGDGFKSLGPDMNESFNPPAKGYTLKNSSSSPINYQVTKTADWLDVSPTNGAIPAEGTTSIKVSINEAKAKALKGATYKDTLTFTNATNGKGNTTRPVELTVAEEQTWQITVKGWEENRMKWDGLVLKDNKTGTTAKIIKGVKFNWALTGKFRIRREEGKWQYKEGSVTAAKLTPVQDFQPKGIYDCSIGKCVGKAQIGFYVGQPITGYVTGNTVQLRWWPLNPMACVNCKPIHADLPKNPYEAMFESPDFVNRISAESYTLANKTYPPITKQDWLYFIVTLKRLQ